MKDPTGRSFVSATAATVALAFTIHAAYQVALDPGNPGKWAGLAVQTALLPVGIGPGLARLVGPAAARMLFSTLGQQAMRHSAHASSNAAMRAVSAAGGTLVINDLMLATIMKALGLSGKIVDAVAHSPAGGLLLAEGKAVLNTTRVEEIVMGATSKLAYTEATLKMIYRAAGMAFPNIDEIIITAERISLRGGWDVVSGYLYRNGVPYLYNGVAIRVALGG